MDKNNDGFIQPLELDKDYYYGSNQELKAGSNIDVGVNVYVAPWSYLICKIWLRGTRTLTSCSKVTEMTISIPTFVMASNSSWPAVSHSIKRTSSPFILKKNTVHGIKYFERTVLVDAILLCDNELLQVTFVKFWAKYFCETCERPAEKSSMRNENHHELWNIILP